MPRYDYICPEGHTTERIVSLKAAPGPRFTACPEQVHRRGKKLKPLTCGKPAKRVEVYTPAVSGTPTRGAF